MDFDLTAASKIVPQEFTILIVDDNVINLRLLMDYLVDYGFNVLVASSGELAIKRAKYTKPDIILLDVMMPGIDGFETCERLKTNKITQDIPVIFMTALSDTKDKVKGFSVGAVDYVTKPLREEEVIARVSTHLNLRNLNRSLQSQNKILVKQALQLKISNQVGRKITSILNADELLNKVTRLIQTNFQYYFVGTWLTNDPENMLVLQANAVSGQPESLDTHTIPLNNSEGIIAHVFRTKQLYLANNTVDDAYYLPEAKLPNTQSELCLPLESQSRFIGVLDIQNNQANSFPEDDVIVLQTLADQIATAIHNAQLYQLTEKRNEELTQLNKDKDKFFSILAHDLKGPFLPLVGSSELLVEMADRLKPEQISNLAEGIHRSVNKVLTLLEDLLQWARVQTGHMECLPTQFNLTELVNDNIGLLATNAADKAIQLRNTVEQVWEVYADKRMLNTVVRNLLSNAIKFTPHNGVITFSARSLSEESIEFVELAVTDTGVGIRPEDLQKLFRIDSHHTTLGTDKETGTGLGLVMCQEMIHRNGGRIWGESEFGAGTVFKFTVPLQAAATPIDNRHYNSSATNNAPQSRASHDWAKQALEELEQAETN